MPGVAVRNRAARASYGPKKLLGRSSNAAASIASLFSLAWPAMLIWLFAVVPSTLVRTVNEQRKATDALLQAARQTQPGERFTAAGQTLIRSATRHGVLAGKVWADDPGTGKRRDLEREEDHAFWAWAIVEVLRARRPTDEYRLPTDEIGRET